MSDDYKMDRRARETHRIGQELAELQFHWGTAYRITFEAGQFCARRRDTGALVRCGTAADLHAEILIDYSAMPCRVTEPGDTAGRATPGG